MKKYEVGYTQGVFDMFHIGHLNLIKNAKEQCEYLIVGVNSDKLVKQYKSKTVVVSENERKQIVESIRFVDKCLIVDKLDKIELWKQLKFDAIFIGDDWKGSKRWIETEQQLKKVNADVIYLKYTKGVSSTELRTKADDKVDD
ncbi:MAG: adenylyltransferase/cytidyltransferase family protein [Lachnospiraceae bacterium]|nr:adenylyltransferase/cytidyltransferase family protein [Lachnospiraceae bacterium]